MQYWKFTDGEGNITSVESHSYPHIVPDATQITKEAFAKYIALLPELPESPEPKDFGTEIDILKAKVASLEKR